MSYYLVIMGSITNNKCGTIVWYMLDDSQGFMNEIYLKY
jgi:hypothetical protein